MTVNELIHALTHDVESGMENLQVYIEGCDCQGPAEEVQVKAKGTYVLITKEHEERDRDHY